MMILWPYAAFPSIGISLWHCAISSYTGCWLMWSSSDLEVFLVTHILLIAQRVRASKIITTIMDKILEGISITTSKPSSESDVSLFNPIKYNKGLACIQYSYYLRENSCTYTYWKPMLQEVQWKYHNMCWVFRAGIVLENGVRTQYFGV